MPPPDSYILEDAGKKRVAEANEGFSEFQYQVFAVTRGWAQANEPALVRYLRAYSRALDWLYDAGNKERAIDGFRERMQLSEDYAARTYGQWIEQEQLFAHKGQPTVPGLQAVEDTVLATGTVPAPLPARDRYLDLHYLEAAGRP
jgi:ABC-type nitrate/sulfonate/bicarbonate transport system substrate-binding protein